MTTFKKLPSTSPSATANTIRNTGGKSASEGNEGMLERQRPHGNVWAPAGVPGFSVMPETRRLTEELLRESAAAPLVARALETARAPGAVAFRALFAGVARRLAGDALVCPTPPALLAPFARPHFTL